MAEYNISMYMTLKIDDLIIEAESEEEAIEIANGCDILTLDSLGANLDIDEIYDVEVEELDDEITILSPDEIDDIFDELIAIEKENFEESQEFDSVAFDYEEFSDYMIDQEVYDSETRRNLWNKFKVELNKIVNEFTKLADEDDN